MASGGVMDVDTYNKKIEAGANLVQVYTGMIYQGPSLISKLLSVSNKD
jgi:dihydroorotate dehydrogenase